MGAATYTLTARATDNANATTTSAPIDITVTAQAALYFIHPDHLNTPRVITNAAQQVVWRWDNDDPFGANMPNENPSGLGSFTCNLRFPGQYFDKETNNHYNYYRDYSPEIGRYVESDPIGLGGGLNTYGYADSDPIAFIDPAGLAKRGPKAFPYPQPPVPYPWNKPKPQEGDEAVPGSRDRPTDRPDRPSQQNSQKKEDCYLLCEQAWDRGHRFYKLMSAMYSDGYVYKACIAPYNEELRDCLKECDETCK